MKKTILFVLPIIILSACTKENSNDFFLDRTDPRNDTTWAEHVSGDAPVNQLFQILAKPSEKHSCNSGTGATIPCENNVQLIIPPDVFGNGLSETADLEITYLKTKGDMIRYGKPTVSNRRILQSGGAFYVTSKVNGVPNDLGSGKYISIHYRTESTQPDMLTFYGDTSINSTTGFNWLPTNDTIKTWRKEDISTGLKLGYDLLSQKFGFINCDRFIDTTSPRTTVSVTLPVNFTNKNTAVFAVFKDMLSVVCMQSDADNRLFYYNNIPIGNNIILVSISKVGDDLYLGTKEVTVSDGLLVELSPEKKSVEEITGFLDLL